MDFTETRDRLLSVK